MKKTFKDVAHYYLGTGLKIDILNYKCDYVGIKTAKLEGFYLLGDEKHFTYKGWSTGKSNDEIKPHLRPLSSLTKPITVEEYNAPIIPAIELAKLCDNGHNQSDSVIKTYNNIIVIKTGGCDDVQSVNIGFNSNEILAISMGGQYITYYTACKIEKLLIKLHFNVFNLPESEYIKIED